MTIPVFGSSPSLKSTKGAMLFRIVNRAIAQGVRAHDDVVRTEGMVRIFLRQIKARRRAGVRSSSVLYS